MKPDLKKWTINSPQDYLPIYQMLALKRSQRLVISLDGPMGAGKTTFVSGLCAFLSASGSPNPVSSPTYALHQQYNLSGLLMDHFDLYRLSHFDELETIGFWESLEKKNGWMLIEWANRLQDWQSHVLGEVIQMQIEAESNGRRILYAACFFPK
jgi:tRNA threonylcarbamoyladenosine biosynthesis protein TsaE